MAEADNSQAIPAEKLKSLVKSKLKIQEQNATSGGEHADEVKKAVDQFGLNRKAYGWICQLEKMSDEKRKDVLRSLDCYRGMMEYDPGRDLVDEMEDQAGDDTRPNASKPSPTATVHHLN